MLFRKYYLQSVWTGVSLCPCVFCNVRKILNFFFSLLLRKYISNVCVGVFLYDHVFFVWCMELMLGLIIYNCLNACDTSTKPVWMFLLFWPILFYTFRAFYPINHYSPRGMAEKIKAGKHKRKIFSKIFSHSPQS